MYLSIAKPACIEVEVATIGILFALKGGHFRAFSRWLKRDDEDLFAGLPDRTRLMRLLQVQQDWYRRMPGSAQFLHGDR